MGDKHHHGHGHDNSHTHSGGCACGHDNGQCGHDHGHCVHDNSHSHSSGCACGHDCGSENVKKELSFIIVGAVLFAAGIAFGDGIIKNVLLIGAYIVVGGEILINALKGLVRGRIVDENLLMSVATIGAMALGDYGEGVMVMLLYRVGELLQGIAVGKSRRSIKEVLDLMPDTVRLEKDGSFVVAPANGAKAGDRFEILPGERIPLDANVIAGESFVDLSAINGESVPVHVGAGDELVSGAINKSGRLVAVALRPAEESTANRIMQAVEEASESKPRIENFITCFAAVYTPVVMGLTLLVAVLPPLLGLGQWADWIHRGLMLLVISCPCALVLSVPLTFFAGLARQSAFGILLKAANVMEVLCNVKAVALDKTGTVTKGSFSITSVKCAAGFEANELVELAAALEAKSIHPIAHAITSAAKGKYSCVNMGEVAGCGVTGTVNGHSVAVGNGKLPEMQNIAVPGEENAKTAVYVAVDGIFAGSIAIDDTVKAKSRNAIEKLRGLGLKTALLTGDSESSAAAVAATVGIERVYHSLMPKEKLDVLRKIREEYGPTVFVGDGINDSVVLSGADVGCAMGIGGADAAVEAADMVLMGDELDPLPTAITISKATMKIAKQNVILALAVKFVVMALSIGGYAQMWMAIFADVGMALVCVLNAVRLLPRKKQKR